MPPSLPWVALLGGAAGAIGDAFRDCLQQMSGEIEENRRCA
jgi:hypothetical protein